MSAPHINLTELTPAQTREGAQKATLLVGPSLGTSVEQLWGQVAFLLADHFHVLGWDLPGHVHSPVHSEDFTMAQLAQGVLNAVDEHAQHFAEPGEEIGFYYAGDSVGGCVGLQLMLDAPQRVKAAGLLCTGAKIGSEESWSDRATHVLEQGTEVMVEGSRQRWFAEGFAEAHPTQVDQLLVALREADATGYAQVCHALAGFDVRDRLGEIAQPVLAMGGDQDQATPPENLEEIAEKVQNGRAEIVERMAHMAPVEYPSQTAALLAELFQAKAARASSAGSPTMDQVYDTGMSVRREVLGDEHVDRSLRVKTDFTDEFQTMITQYAWNGIWGREGLDRKTRSFITLTAMVALGHHEEFQMHVRAAFTNGLTQDEIKETLLQCAIYCGVPAANTAFKLAQEVLDGLEG